MKIPPKLKTKIRDHIIQKRVDLAMFERRGALTPEMTAQTETYIQALKWVLKLEEK